MLQSFGKYITFTDIDGDAVVVLKSAIESVYQDPDSANICIELISGLEYELPVTSFITYDDVISKIFY